MTIAVNIVVFFMARANGGVFICTGILIDSFSLLLIGVGIVIIAIIIIVILKKKKKNFMG